MKIYRAIVASGDKLNAFYRAFINFDTTQYKTNPEQIYNIYEKGISIVYTPPWIVCNKDIKAQAITFTRSSLTIIKLLELLRLEITCLYFMCLRGDSRGSVPWTDGMMIETKIFENYLTEFYDKHTGVTYKKNYKPVLVWYDGHMHDSCQS